MTQVFKWKRPVKGIDSQVAGEYLNDLGEKHGGITPELLVDESKTKDALFHSCFEWNDKKAAAGYRVVQAKEILRNITVIKVESSDDDKVEMQEVRAFHSIEVEDGKQKYISLPVILSDEDMMKQMLQRAIRELTSFRNKYKALQQLQPVFEIIDKLVS
jgi:hypothetical protein